MSQLTEDQILALEAKHSKHIDTKRTEGRKTVQLFTNIREALAAGYVDEDAIYSVDAPLEMRNCVVTSAELLSEGIHPKQGAWKRYALIGRDIATNQTVRTWTVGKSTYEVGAIAEFPCFQMKAGKFYISMKADKSTTYLLALKDGFQHCEEAQAVAWNEARMAGYAAVVAAVSRKAAVVEP